LFLFSGAVAVIGALGLIAQVVIFREFLGIFAGNEISAGVLLSIWLLFEGLGAWFSGRYAPRLGRGLWDWFTGIGILSGFSTIASVILIIFSPKLAGLIPGEILNLHQLIAITILAVLLPAGTHGALFSLSAEIFSQVDRRTGVSRAYIYEGLGTFLAGLLLYFLLLSRLAGIGIILLFTGVMLVALALIYPRRIPAICIFLAGSLVVLASSALADSFSRSLMQAVWRGHRVLAVRESPYGKLVTLEREGRRQVLYDGTVIMDMPRSEIIRDEELGYLPMLFHGRPRDVLILGGGRIGLINEVLRFPVSRVQVIELDPVLIAETERAGGQMVAEMMSEPRVEVVTADPRRFFSVSDDSFDVIILSLPAPANLNANRLFSIEFYQQCARRLKPGGIVVTPMPGSGDNLVFEAGVIAGIRQSTLGRVFPCVYALGLDAPLIIASMQPLEFLPEVLANRLRMENPGLTVLTPEYLSHLLDSFRQQRFRSKIVNSRLINYDLLPVELFYNLVRESRRFSPRIADLMARLPLAVGQLTLPLLVMVIVVAIAGSLLRSGFARGFGIMSSGFAGAGVSTLTIMVYQLRFGSVYSGVAVLFASFILGSVTGAYLSEWLKRVRLGLLFLGGDLMFLVILGMMLRLARSGGQTLLVLTLMFAGLILGWQFAVASAERQTVISSGGRTAGLLGILDFSGGAIGGFTVAVVLVPVTGVVNTILIIAAVKLSSAVAQLLTLGKSRFTIQRV